MPRSHLLIDMCTQCDFLCENSPCEVRNREQLIKRMKRVIAWARLSRVPIVSAIDAHRPQESTNGRPRHCIDGTEGQLKLPFTLLPDRTLLEADNSFAVPLNLLKRYRQVLLRKRTEDLLANPKADRLLSECRVGEMVIFGVGIESGIKALALGLLTRQKRVAVVVDACGYWDWSAADLALRQIEAKGARIIHVEDLRVLPKRTYRKPRWLVRRAALQAEGNGRAGARTAVVGPPGVA